MSCKYAAKAAEELARLNADEDEEDGMFGKDRRMKEEEAEEEKGIPGDETDVDGRMPTLHEQSDLEMEYGDGKGAVLGEKSDVE